MTPMLRAAPLALAATLAALSLAGCGAPTILGGDDAVTSPVILDEQAAVAAISRYRAQHGLPPLVREDDQFRAQITLRNTTKAAMKVEVSPRATLLDLKPQTIDIPAG